MNNHRAVITQRRVDGRWVNVLGGSWRTAEEADAAGQAAARLLHAEWFHRGLLGRLLRRNSYGNDRTDRPG